MTCEEAESHHPRKESIHKVIHRWLAAICRGYYLARWDEIERKQATLYRGHFHSTRGGGGTPSRPAVAGWKPQGSSHGPYTVRPVLSEDADYVTKDPRASGSGDGTVTILAVSFIGDRIPAAAMPPATSRQCGSAAMRAGAGNDAGRAEQVSRHDGDREPPGRWCGDDGCHDG